MAVIEDADLGNDYWCTTEDVRDEFVLEVGNQQPDFDKRIKQATRAIQADWAEATGKGDSDLPDPVPELLQDATAYLAASKAHLAYAQNISGDNQGDQRHVFLEQESEKSFDRWKAKADLSAESEADGEASESVGGLSGVIGGTDRSPIYRGDD